MSRFEKSFLHYPFRTGMANRFFWLIFKILLIYLIESLNVIFLEAVNPYSDGAHGKLLGYNLGTNMK